jgi:hypothetical protein
MNPTLEYHFRSNAHSGSVTIDGGIVHSSVRQGFSRFTYPTPLSKVHPHPIKSWSTPTDIWFLFAFSLGVTGMLLYDAVSASPEMSTILRVPMIAACVGIFCYACKHRREEWVIFSTMIEGHWVRYCRSGRDRLRFDRFTDELTGLIHEAQRQDGE